MSYSEYQYSAPPAQAPGYDSTYSQGYDMTSYVNDPHYSTGPPAPSAIAAPPPAATGHYEYSQYPAEQYAQSPPGAANSSGFSHYNYSTAATGYPPDHPTYDQYSYIPDKVSYQAALPTPAPAPLPDQTNAYSAVSPPSSAVPALDYGNYQYEQRGFNQPTAYGQNDSSYNVSGYNQSSAGYDHAGPPVSNSQRPYSTSTGYGHSGVSSESYNQSAGFSGSYYDANTSASSYEKKDVYSDYTQGSGNYKQSNRSYTQPYYSHSGESSSYSRESEEPGRNASSGEFRDGGFGGKDFRPRSDGKNIMVSKGSEPAHRGARGGGSFPGGPSRGRGRQSGGSFNEGRSNGNQYRQEEPVFSSSRERSTSFESRGSNSNSRNRNGDGGFNSRGRVSSFSSRSIGSTFSARGRSSFSNRGGTSSFSTRGAGNAFSTRGGNSSNTRGGGGSAFIDKEGENFNNRHETGLFESRGGSSSFNVRGRRGSFSSRGQGGGRGRTGGSFVGGSAFSNIRGGAPPFGNRDGGVSSFRGMAMEEDNSHNQNEGVFSTTTAMTQKSFGNRGGSFGGRGTFNRGGTGAARIDRFGSTGKSQPASGDARNRINELKNKTVASGAKVPAKLVPTGTFTPGVQKSQTPVPVQKPSQQKQITKAPSRPQDKLLNEIEQKEKAKKEEEEKKAKEAIQKAAEEENAKLLEEEAKKKAKETMVLAPPSKPPETAEEIAQEEEIQKKIRESIVVVLPEQELAMLSEDPSKDIEMPQELRDLLKDLTTDYVCKLCSVRIVGPQMGTMHYNGKNHLKKLRNFVQTNGRSAGFNLEKGDSDENEKAVKEKSENVEETEMDPKKYCKLCKITFLQENQSEMHYKGKNHAKKVRNQGVENGTEIFECKICCVTVTAQEHLTAHLNGARHKLQLRKMEGDNAHRGGLRGRGRGSFRGGRGAGCDEGDRRPFGESGRGRGGFQGRGRGEFRGRGRGRGGAHDYGGFKRPSSEGGRNMGGNYGGPSFNKRPRFF